MRVGKDERGGGDRETSEKGLRVRSARAESRWLDILSTPVASGATPLSVNRFNDISDVSAMIYST